MKQTFLPHEPAGSFLVIVDSDGDSDWFNGRYGVWHYVFGNSQ